MHVIGKEQEQFFANVQSNLASGNKHLKLAWHRWPAPIGQLVYNKHCYYGQVMDENIGTLLAQVSRLLRRTFDERARGIGVTRPQWLVLGLLKAHAGSNQGALAEMLEVEPITLGRMIDRLQEAELVERRADPADRRAWRIFLTDKGERLLDQLRPLGRETLARALEGVSEADHEQLIATLARVRTNLSRKAQAEVAVNG